MSGARFTTTKPKLFDSRIFHDAFVDAAEKVMQDAAKSFTDATRDWKHKPTFVGTVKVTNKNIAINIQTDDLIFKFVDQGTKPHRIYPKNANALVFYWGKVGMNTVVPKAGGFKTHVSKDTYWVGKGYVDHPGYAGSKISESVQEIWAGLMPDYFDEALRRTAKETGHTL